ncbi:unnamed protein product, partial [Choristocarpus tenellus]
MEDTSSMSCLLCNVTFTFTNRRHHCRNCLKLVCSACSSRVYRLNNSSWRGESSRRHHHHHHAPSGGVKKRVCDKCYTSLVATGEVMVGGDKLTLNSGEHAHFEVVIHEICGRMVGVHSCAPPVVPVGPSSPPTFSRSSMGEGWDAAAVTTGNGFGTRTKILAGGVGGSRMNVQAVPRPPCSEV